MATRPAAVASVPAGVSPRLTDSPPAPSRPIAASAQPTARPAPRVERAAASRRPAAQADLSRADNSVRPAPALDLRHLDTDAAAVLGPGVAPPPVLPPVVAARGGGPGVVEGTAVRPAATGTSGTAAADLHGAERDRVRAVLSRYERAYSQLDAASAAALYPAIDRKALARAFGSLSSQQVLFDDCRIQVEQSSARATCAGTASWTPKVGGGPRDQARQWQFDLRQVSGDWQIGAVKVQ
jgi:hypothetical protein